MKKKILTLLCTMTLLATMLQGCGSTNSSDPTPASEETKVQLPDCPFSELKWDATPDDVFALEGDKYETYDSIYNGVTYSFTKSYLDNPGTIKYMFDDKNALMCIAWTYSGDINDLEPLQALYDTIHSSLVSKYGESGYHNGGSTSSGDVWYMETGNVLVATMITNDATALQYSYLHPDVSHEKPVNAPESSAE